MPFYYLYYVEYIGIAVLLLIILGIAIQLYRLVSKKRAEDEFEIILKEYLKNVEASKRTLELMAEINSYVLRRSLHDNTTSQSQKERLGKYLELSYLQSEFIELTEKLGEKDRRLINEGLMQPSTTGRIGYMTKLLEKANVEA